MAYSEDTAHSGVSQGHDPAKKTKHKPLPAPSFLRKVYTYDDQSGRLIHNERGLDMFKESISAKYVRGAEWSQKRWNNMWAGKFADTTISNYGYRTVRLCDTSYLAHRIIWAIKNDLDPFGFDIDHINGDCLDNRIINLRAVSHKENMRNRKISSSNKTGVHGVNFDKRFQKWAAIIVDNNDKRVFLGHFLTLADAAMARLQAERKYGYHENHGRS